MTATGHPAALLAAAAVAATAWIVTDPLSGWRRRVLRESGRHPRTARRRGLVVVGAGIGVAVLLVAPEAWLLALIAGSAAWAGGGLVERAAARRQATQVAGRVREICEQIAADLDAGQPPGAALDRAAQEWSPIEPVAAAFGLGGDVPDGLRQVAASPGAEDLRLVAAAWQVGQRSGLGLAQALGRVAEGLAAAESTRRLVTSELASARATARLLAGLPVLALLMGTGVGGNPWAFLLTTTPGLLCLAGGLALAFVGLAWIERLAGEIERW